MTPIGAQQSLVDPPPLGLISYLGEITKLRREKAQLEAVLIDRDRQIANLRYELGKRLLELQADLDEARLNRRAEDVLKRLRELLDPPPDSAFDWSTGQFVSPPKGERK